MNAPLQDPLPFDTAPPRRAPARKRALRAVPTVTHTPPRLTPQDAAEQAAQAPSDPSPTPAKTAPTCHCGGDPIGHVHPDKREVMP
jgi:hypothetical protein